MSSVIRSRTAEYEERIDLAEIIRVMWGHRLWMVLITLACGIAAAVYALLATPIFSAETTVTEIREGGLSGAAASVAGQLGGLASFAGLNLNSSGGTGQHALAVLHSRHLLEEFIKRYSLEKTLLPNSQKPPTLWRAVERFRGDVLSFNEDKLRGTTKVDIRWTDPETAARWANELVALANELLRTRALEDAERNISYLREQISKTNVVEMQRVMYDLIETQTKTLMLANARAEFAFEVVDPAVPSEVRTSPKRTLIVLGGLVIGFVLSMFASLLHDKLARQRVLARPVTHSAPA